MFEKQILKEKENLFLWTPVFFGTGIGLYFSLLNEPSFLWGASLWFIVFLINLFYRFRVKKMLVFFLILSGFLYIQTRTIFLSTDSLKTQNQKLYLSGRIDKIDTNYKGKPRLIISQIRDFEENKISGRYRLSLIQKSTSLKVGDCVEMIAVVSKPFPTSFTQGYQFDRSLFFKNIKGVGYIQSEVLKIDCPYPTLQLKDNIEHIRQNITARIEKILPQQEAGVTVAIVAGNQGKIDKNLMNTYRDSGLAHFLSISGLHMSMLAGLMFFLVRLIMSLIPSLALRYNSKKIAAFLAIIVSAFYLLISGAEIPAQRAFIMTSIVFCAVLCDRQAISMRSLACAALFVLIVSPSALMSASFQMSFAAVAALVAFYEKYSFRLSHFLNAPDASLFSKIIRGLAAYLVGVVVADFVASMATLPFAIYHFNRVALYSSLTNMICGPIIGFIVMPFVLISLLLLPLGIDYYPLKIVGFGIGKINEVIMWVTSLPYATADVCSQPLWGLILIVFGGLWLCLWKTKWRHLGWLLIFCGSLSFLMVKIPDVIVDKEQKTIALKTIDNRFYFAKEQNRWNKETWLKKYAVKESRDKSQIPESVFSVDKFGVINDGFSVYYINDKIEIETIKSVIGNRPWNS